MTMSLVVEHFDNLLVTPENAEQLNRAILKLAMQGKLVDQDPKDEAASELYWKIIDEKRKFLAENNYSDTNGSSIKTEDLLFNIPHGWKWCKLGELTFIIRGASPRPKGNPDYYSDKRTSYHWVKISDIRKFSKDGVLLDTEEFLTEAGRYKSVLLEKGTLIITNSATIGVPVFLGINGCIHDGYLGFRFSGGEGIDRKYLYFYFLAFLDEMRKRARGLAQLNLNSSIVRDLPFPLPPIAEQKRIVARVEELFAQTRTLAKELEHSQIELDGLNKSALSHLLASENPEEFNQHWEFIAEHFDLLFQAPEHVAPLRQSILELAVRGKLTRREAGDQPSARFLEDIGKKPLIDSSLPALVDGWCWVRLEDLSKRVSVGHVGITSNFYCDSTEGIPFLRSQNVRRGHINYSGMQYITHEFHNKLKKSQLEPGDLLVVRVGANRGDSCIVPDHYQELNCANIVFARPITTELSPYLNAYFQTEKCQERLSGKTTGSAQGVINTKVVAKVVVPLPPLAEQERIVKRVEQLLSLCDALSARLQSAEEERGRLVRAVMSTVGG